MTSSRRLLFILSWTREIWTTSVYKKIPPRGQKSQRHLVICCKGTEHGGSFPLCQGKLSEPPSWARHWPVCRNTCKVEKTHLERKRTSYLSLSATTQISLHLCLGRLLKNIWPSPWAIANITFRWRCCASRLVRLCHLTWTCYYSPQPLGHKIAPPLALSGSAPPVSTMGTKLIAPSGHMVHTRHSHWLPDLEFLGVPHTYTSVDLSPESTNAPPDRTHNVDRIPTSTTHPIGSTARLA